MKTKAKSRPKPYDEMSTTGALQGPNPVKRSIRPIARPDRTVDLTPNAEEGDQMFIGAKPPRSQKKAAPKKMAKGGTCRGMGAATRGGSYKAG
jgi:hypothetical protein